MPQPTLTTWLTQSRKNWAVLTQLAVFIIGIVGGFLIPPPAGISETEDTGWLRLGQFVITVTVGVIFLANLGSRKRNIRRWWIVSTCFLIMAVMSFFLYKHLTYRWTCTYFGDTVVVGSQHTQMGKHYVEQNPDISCRQLLVDFAGGTDKIWTKDSIDRNRWILGVTYISCIPLFALCIIALLNGFRHIK